MNIDSKVEILGQVFTPDFVVDYMLGLRRNFGSVLEPSCGNGAISNKIESITAIEIDRTVAPAYATIMDFFDYPLTNKFDTIIGNPPYVEYQNIQKSTKINLDKTLFDNRTNLYLFFIQKCINHLTFGGEIIFIVPAAFLKASSCKKFNSFLFDRGTITDALYTSRNGIFGKHSVNCLIFRYQKDNFCRTMRDGKTCSIINGQLFFSKEPIVEHNLVKLSDFFEIKSGASSGADYAFVHEDGVEFVCSQTRSTGITKKMIYDTYTPSLDKHKVSLINRDTKKFNETNWFRWYRKCGKSELSHSFYVNTKTRKSNPFFHHDCKLFDASVLALYIKQPEITPIEKCVAALNSVDWENF